MPLTPFAITCGPPTVRAKLSPKHSPCLHFELVLEVKPPLTWNNQSKFSTTHDQLIQHKDGESSFRTHIEEAQFLGLSV
jgi:hypothetical protein